MPKKQQKTYALLYANTVAELEEEVNARLDDGWELKDPTWTDSAQGTMIYFQVMTR